VLLTAAGGCVSKSKYVELEDMYNQAAKERDQLAGDLDKAKDKRGQAKARDSAQMEAFKGLFKDMMIIHDKGVAKVTIEDGRAVIGLESDVLFASGSADLTDKGKESITEIAGYLKKSSAAFQVEGHTDSDPISSAAFPSNWHLGADRAIVVTKAFIDAGFPAGQISAATYADQNPVGANDTSAGKAANRRIEIVLMPELSELLPYGRIMNELKNRKGGKAQRSNSNRMEAEATDE